MAKPKKLTSDEKLDILSKHIGVLRGMIKEQGISQSRSLNALLKSPAPAAQPAGHAIPSRPEVVATVIRTLKDALIMENAQEFTSLTNRFEEVNDEDTHMGHPGFRIGRFLDILHARLPWHWGIGPNELLDGTLPNAASIADRTLASA